MCILYVARVGSCVGGSCQLAAVAAPIGSWTSKARVKDSDSNGGPATIAIVCMCSTIVYSS